MPITLYEGTYLADQTGNTSHCIIDVCKFSDGGYGHYAGATADHLTIARWHVKPKPVDESINNIISSAVKSMRS